MPDHKADRTNHFALLSTVTLAIVLALLAFVLYPVFSPPRGCRPSRCPSNMKSIGKALKMYCMEWDDITPTNRTLGQDRFLSHTCRLAGKDNVKYSVNFVEALTPYLKRMDDTQNPQLNWRCPSASRKAYPEVWGKAAISTYCMNWYLTEMPINSASWPSNTLLFRELDRRAHALLRPHPSIPPNAEHPRGSGRPISVFPSRSEFGADDAEPSRHADGSNVLFADGHLAFFLSTQLDSAPVMDDDMSDETPPGKKASTWRVGTIWITP